MNYNNCNTQVEKIMNYCPACGVRLRMKCEINFWRDVDSWSDLSEVEKESFRCTEDFSHPVSREALKRLNVYVCSTCAAEYTFEGEKCDSCKKGFDNDFVRVSERNVYIRLKGEQNDKLCIMKQDADNIPKSKIVVYDTGEELETKDIEYNYLWSANCKDCEESRLYEDYWGDEDWADYYGMDVEDYKRDGGESHGH